MKAKLLLCAVTFLLIWPVVCGQSAFAAEEEATGSASLQDEDVEASPSAEILDEPSEDEISNSDSTETAESENILSNEEPTANSVTNSVRIEGQFGSLFYGDITHQSVTFNDTSGVSHTIDRPTALGAALTAAQQSGISYELVDYGAFGFYLQSMNGEGPSGNLGWLYKVKGVSPMVGAGDYEVAEGDEVIFFYGDWQNPNQPLLLESGTDGIYLGDKITFQVSRFDESSGEYLPASDAVVEVVELDLEISVGSDGSAVFVSSSTGTFTAVAEAPGQIRSQQLSIIVSPIPISENQNPAEGAIDQAVQDGVDYLEDQQDEEGKISSLGVSAWAAMAFSAADINPDTVIHSPSLMDYLAANIDQLTLPTDWERQTLAILAAGMDPRDFGGEDCVQRILDYYQDDQLGDSTLLNDDIFGALALLGSGLDPNDSVIDSSLGFLLANQNADGGFSFGVGGDSDTNTTAAALQALVYATEVGGFSFDEAIESAKEYLLINQNADGGFPYMFGNESDASSTAWIVLAFNALNVDPLSLTNRFGLYPISYLLDMQNEDGSFSWVPGFVGDSFTTSFAIQALSGAHWPIIGDFAENQTIVAGDSGQENDEDSGGDDDNDSDSNDVGDTETGSEGEENSVGGRTEEVTEGSVFKSIGEVLGEAVVPPAFANQDSESFEEVVTDSAQRGRYIALVVISGAAVLVFLRRFLIKAS